MLVVLTAASPAFCFPQTPVQDAATRALGSSPNSPAANIALGETLLGEHRYPEAMERFETVLATNLHDPNARKDELAAATALALEARAAGHPEAALACLTHARESLPDDPTLLTDFGIQAQQMHLLPEAAEALKAALLLSPQRLDAIYALARVETDQDHLPEAEQHLRAYLAARPGDASAHFGLGHVLERQQKTDAAASEFRRSIQLQPTQTESYYQLGQMALDVHQDASARPLFEKTLARNPRHGGALTGLGIIAYRAKDYEAARQQLFAATEASPNYQPAHYYLGLTLARLGDKPASDHELKTAVELAGKQQGKGEPLSPQETP
jgi:tetratricopeptide (TPR) repeat protein